MFYNAQVRATKIRSWECQHPNENKSQNTKKGIKAQYKPLSFPYNSAPWSCATETNLAWVGGFFSHQKKQLNPFCLCLKQKQCQPVINFGFVEFYGVVFYCLGAQTKLSGCSFQNVSSHVSTQDEEVEHPALITLVTNRSFLGQKHPKKRKRATFPAMSFFRPFSFMGFTEQEKKGKP